MNIEKKIINNKVIQSTNYEITSLDENHYVVDDPKNKTLTVNLFEFKPPFVLTIKNPDYDALGQWTDENLNQFIINKFNLTINTGSVTQPTGSI